MRIDRRPVTDWVWAILTLDGHIAPPLPKVAPVALANAAGVFGAGITVDGRRVAVRLDLRPASLVDRRTVLDALAYRLGGGVLHTLSFDDAPDRYFLATAETPEVVFTPPGIAYGLPRCEITLTFLLAPTHAIELEPKVYALSTTPTPMPIGPSSVAPLLWVFGASTPVVDPEVLVTAHTGEEVGRLTFSVSLAADDYLAIDAATQRVERYVAGVRQTGQSSGLAAVASGQFPVLSIEDAAPELGAWPRLALTAASGTPTGAAAFARRW